MSRGAIQDSGTGERYPLPVTCADSLSYFRYLLSAKFVLSMSSPFEACLVQLEHI